MPRRVRVSLLVGLVAVYLLPRPLGMMSVDEEFLFCTTAALAERGSLEIEPVGQNRSETYGKFGALPSLVAVPFYWLGKSVAHFAPAELAEDALRAVTASASALWMAWAALELIALLALLGFTNRVQLASALLFALATPALVYARSFHISALSTLLVVALVRRAVRYQTARSDRAAVWLGAVMAVVLLVSFHFILLVPVLGWFVWLNGRRSGDVSDEAPQATPRTRPGHLPTSCLHLCWFLLSAGVGWAVVVLVNVLRDGHWLYGNYGGENFVTPLRVGLYGLLFSAGRGLIWFSPLTVPAVLLFGRFWRARRRLAWLVAALFAVVAVTSAKWWAWNGGTYWGPRYLVPLVSLTVIPLAYYLRDWRENPPIGRLAVAALVLLSMAVQVKGVCTDYFDSLRPVNAIGAGENELYFLPQLHPLWWQADVRPLFLWTKWYQQGYGLLAFASVGVLAAVALSGVGYAVAANVRARDVVGILSARQWSLLLAVVLIWGGGRLWLTTGHGLSVTVEGAGDEADTSGQFNRPRWAWRAPAPGASEWTGHLRVPQNGDYAVYLWANGPAKLEVAGKVQLSREPPGTGAPTAPNWSVWRGRLDVGLYELVLRVEPQHDRPARAGLAWTIHGASIDRQPISPQYLYPAEPGRTRLLADRAVEWSWLAILLAGVLLLSRVGGENVRGRSDPGDKMP